MPDGDDRAPSEHQSIPERTGPGGAFGILRGVIQSLYDTVLRERLPMKIAVYNGIPARRVRLLDDTDVMYDYEARLLSALKQYISANDTVVDIGGGFGVAAVTAANQTGPDGQVITYEASADHVDIIRETALMNQVEDRIEVRNVIVGTGVDIWGDTADTTVMDPSRLPSCDVLVMDCEGAEGDILANLRIEPQTVVVEVHPHLGSSVDRIERIFDDLQYRVLSRDREVGDTEIYIVVATRESVAEVTNAN
jgi:predicted RNA methylase